jgi:hypothetical protein
MSSRGSSADAYRHSTAYGYTTMNANATNADTTNPNMADADTDAANASSCRSVG